MATIKDLYNGNIRPCYKYIINNSEYNKICIRINAIENKILAEVDNKIKKHLDEIEELYSKLLSITDEECFSEGFRLGVKLTIDSLQGKSENFTDMVL